MEVKIHLSEEESRKCILEYVEKVSGIPCGRNSLISISYWDREYNGSAIMDFKEMQGEFIIEPKE